MNKKKAIRKSARASSSRWAHSLTYVLLPNGDSIGGAKNLPPASTQKAMAAAARGRPKTRADGARATAFVVRNKPRPVPGRGPICSRGRAWKAFFTQSETVFVLKKPGVASASNARLSRPRSCWCGANPTRKTRARRTTRRFQSRRAHESGGANMVPAVTGMESLPGKINYFRGNDEQKMDHGRADVPEGFLRRCLSRNRFGLLRQRRAAGIRSRHRTRG